MTPADNQCPNNLGAPVAGAEVKILRAHNELRLRGPMVTPGYWRNNEATAAAFDDDGFFRTGDAGRLLDPDDASAGIVFTGRIAENFKLTSGTWVRVNELRLAVIEAASPLVHDVVVAGHDRDEVGLLIFPDPVACEKFTGATDPGSAESLRHPALREHLLAAMREMNANKGSSSRVTRALLLDTVPDAGAGEITDKGYINQRAVLANRAEAVERLYRDTDSAILRP